MVDAWRQAEAANQRLRASESAAHASDHDVQASRAEFWPSITVEGAYLLRDNEPAYRFSFPTTPVTAVTAPYLQREGGTVQTVARLPLDFSGRIRAQLDAAEFRASAASTDSVRAVADLRLNLADTFISVLRAQRDVDVAHAHVRRLTRHLEEVEKLYQNGRVPQNDVLAARVSLADSQQRQQEALRALDVVRAQYNRWLGRRLDAPVALEEFLVRDENRAIEALATHAQQHRPELAVLAAQAEALRRQAEGIRAAHRPQVELQAAYGFTENRFQDPEGLASAAVAVSWNVFDASRNRWQFSGASCRAEEAVQLLADARTQVELQVRTAFIERESSRRRTELARSAIDHADENLRVARHRYAMGRGTHVEVLDAETMAREAARNFYGALYDHLAAHLRLHYAVGGLTPEVVETVHESSPPGGRP